MEEKIIQILKKYSYDEEAFNNFKDDADLKDDLGVNSGRIMDIVLDIEEEFNIQIEDKIIPSMKLYKDVVGVIKLKIGKK